MLRVRTFGLDTATVLCLLAVWLAIPAIQVQKYCRRLVRLSPHSQGNRSPGTCRTVISQARGILLFRLLTELGEIAGRM
jgi:hypothetical protein